MKSPWINFLKLAWSSDWDGYEVGYDKSEIVGLYDLIDTNYSFYIDMITMEILEVIYVGDCE